MQTGTISSNTVVTTTMTSGGWGRGRSFADIVKKQDSTENETVNN